MTVSTHQDLLCTGCGRREFIRTVNLRYHPNTGTSVQEIGWRCADCAAVVDVGRMARHLQLKMEKAELAAKIEQIEAEEPPMPPMPEKPAAKKAERSA